ncbi:hypothetical protein [Pseudoduganella chitinolytica]|uniref:Uncharacterized protein n=1 Tax=Pseudoduganella chitinolytica TaxID=34070 RepID=A0ABY8BJ24_9BURK|nr:hypothetical protein [Pseudoduganella chitinolytica]WEF34672.1 hypothetical protein PX653_07895 [Pseudoduganella chitinolytica]
MERFDTHEVFNPVAPFGDIHLFACDPALGEALVREGGGAAQVALRDCAAILARALVEEGAAP